MISILERFKGSLLGLAAGDALGTTLEFTQPGDFEPLTDMVGGGPFHLEPGQWTDDTSMALCLADSLLHCNGFDAKDQMERYVRWYREGYRSSTGTCFDIGNATYQALSCFEQTQNPYSGSTNANTAGNGSIMRLALVPLFYHQTPELALRYAADSSRTTHGAKAAVDACVYLAGLMVGALQGRSKEELLLPLYTPVLGFWKEYDLSPEIEEIAKGSFKHRNPPLIQGSGYVVKSLEAALWAFYNSSTFEDGCLLAVNLGDDSDTTGAVYGQLAGAYYGSTGIPEHWRDLLNENIEISRLAMLLLEKEPKSM
ncbi:ADP-ribosylglycohydrolase family protein [Rufibacter tibetensis]|uniref:ADP-ribosylglycohydrolase n=1 Tax=Rufibacter tibetensis TaxID=512763 RepID=A0A0N7HW28_9BACT|nr:ADP-ribosylglycohydrolase family protein [Rufibacter tibetensis]ALI98088.1 ADP-ribosylglycohydrolase [Rufibacter tibetensis]